MPHSLTQRQKDYLKFLRQYITENQSSPQLNELAQNFNVKPSTAHKTLEALQSKGYLFFGRDSTSGFFIRLIDRAGAAETVIEVAIAGKVNRYGFVQDFPEKLGHFASVHIGSDPSKVFALAVIDNIPEASIDAGDLIIFELERKPKPGDICIFNWDDWLLIRAFSYTYDPNIKLMEIAVQYPMPEDLQDKELHQWINWTPLAWNENNHEYFLQYAEDHGLPIMSIPPNLIAGTALRLSRALTW